jgi:hypothetical protein
VEKNIKESSDERGSRGDVARGRRYLSFKQGGSKTVHHRIEHWNKEEKMGQTNKIHLRHKSPPLGG